MQPENGQSMKTEIRLGNPFLIFICSLALLALGVAIGMRWHSQSVTAFSMALLGAALMVLHDVCSALIWMALGAKWAQVISNSKKRC
jgi:hypothetical protein